jgi:dTDP-4-amino-4,6-dideoxygalactose transaminase
VLNTPFAPWPAYSDQEIDAVARVLRSNRVNYWTGEECRRFEAEFARACGAAHAVALANGTVALDAALLALGVHPGDEVVVTPRSYFASASSVVNAGAVPVFADVDRDSQNLTARSIEAVLTDRTRGIVLVHLAGWPCDMDPIMALARQRGLWVIEDCSQAHGATYRGRPVGSIGDIGTWSFCQDKIMTTGGEGGMVTTDDETLWRRIWEYKDHGKSWDAVHAAHAPGFRWLHRSFGTNWRMTEMQAVLGRLQLERLPEWTRQRTRNAHRLVQAMSGHRCVRVPQPSEDSVHAYYRLYAFVVPEALAPGWSRDRVVSALVAAGMPCYHGSCPEIYLEKAFDDTRFRPNDRLPIARELGETSLMMLVHPTLTETDLGIACDALSKVLAAATREAPGSD